jgi:hypothetical protein
MRIIKSGGAKATPGGKVTDHATVLVRGDSSFWAYGDHGLKEQQAAALLRRGKPISVVHDFEFRNLLESGRPARVADRVAGEPVRWLIAPSKRQFRSVAELGGPLDREYSARGRVEQSYLRHILFGNENCAKCSLWSNVSHVASHSCSHKAKKRML